MDGQNYDQAVRLYDAVAKRRKSRFLYGGRLPGLLCLVSSARYPGEFTERKLREAAEDDSIYVYRKRLWDVKPDAFSSDYFEVFVGDETRAPRIIAESDGMFDPELIEKVPIDFRQDFERDIDGAIRDIAGRPTNTIHPFIRNREAVNGCFDPKQLSVLSLQTVDFSIDKLEIHKDRIINPHLPRWCHVDLALNRDSAGVAVGHVSRFIEVDQGESKELRPVVTIDLSLEVVPPKGGEIQISRIRDLIYKLRDVGMNLMFVSFDGYQSADSIQILKEARFIAGLVSVDRNTDGYEILRQALYEGRVCAAHHEKLQTELLALEYDAQRGKVDHPLGGSKDVADAVAAMVSSISHRRESYAAHHVAPVRAHTPLQVVSFSY